MPVAWPTNLPLPLIRAEASRVTGGSRITMESRRVRQRRSLVNPIKLLQVQWNFTEDQFVTFKSFFETDLVNGSLSFSLELFGVSKEVSFLESRYAFTRSDNLFQVSTTLEYASLVDVTLTLSMVGGGSMMTADTQGQIRITVTNGDEGPAKNVELTVVLPASFAYGSSSPAMTAAGQTLTYEISELAASGSQVVDIYVTPADGGTFTVSGSITARNTLKAGSVTNVDLTIEVFDPGACAVTTITDGGGDTFDCYTVGEIT